MKIGIIGGSGLYELEALENRQERTLTTTLGDPSDSYMAGTIGDVEVFFLPRHGRGHRLLPCEINYRANILGFKMLGVERVLSVSAVGSLREELRPRDIVLPDQYFDRTKADREHTFFGEGIVAHVSFAEPTCPELRAAVAATADRVVAGNEATVRVTEGGTYVNMAGPAFSTKAESRTYRKLGFDIIGMTSLAEAKLCKEAELCYQSMSMVTDYDCWRESEEVVTVEMIIEHLVANTALAKQIITDLVPSLDAARTCTCGSSLANAIITAKDAIPATARETLGPVVAKYLS